MPKANPWPRSGRQRARELAFLHADNADIVDALREEFPASKNVNPAKRHAECSALVEEMADELDRQRTRGRLHIMDRLVAISNSGEREALTATTWLAREVLGHAKAVDIRTKQLAKLFRGYSHAELRRLLDEMSKRVTPKDNVLTLGGGK